MRRRDQRRAAVFALYQQDATGKGLDEALPRDAHPFTRALAHAVEDHKEELDAVIERHSTGWTLDRIAPLGRAILRAALCGMLHPGDVPGEAPLPPEGAIGGGVEPAKRFWGGRAPSFVNGVPRGARDEVRRT